MLKNAAMPVRLIIIVTAVLTIAGAALLPTGTAIAAPAGGIGYVDLTMLVATHPDIAGVQQTMQAAAEQAQKEFNEKSASMNDKDKAVLAGQFELRLFEQERALVEPIRAKVVAVVKDVADKKGLIAVIDKSMSIYGGEDITAEVGRKLAGK